MPPADDRARDKNEVFAMVRTALESEFGLSADRIELSTHLIDELDLDSIDALDLAASMEETLGFTLRDDDLKSVRIVQDVVELIYSGLVARCAAER